MYIGYFRDIDDDKLFKVSFIKKNEGANPEVKEITLGASPFVTDMNEGDTIYEPLKTQTASVELASEDYLFEIYSSEAQGTKVKLEDESNNILFIGYVTPNLYDMGFQTKLETITIEGTDALASLEYIKFDNRNIISFLDLIKHLLGKCNAYNNFYISTDTKLNENDTDALIEKIWVSGNNFFNKKNNGEEDKDVAWSCKEVLEEVCKYLNVVCYADGDDVYFIDYDAIKNDNNKYNKFSINNNAYNGDVVELKFTKTINENDYNGGENTLSLDNVYSKVSVKDDNNTYESIIPSIYDNLHNITKSTDPLANSEQTYVDGKHMEIVTSDIENGATTEPKTMIVFVDNVDAKPAHRNIVAVKYFYNPNFKFYRYIPYWENYELKMREDETFYYLNYSDCKKFYGAYIAKYFVKKVTEDFAVAEMFGEHFTLDDYMNYSEVTKLDFDNYIVLSNSYDPWLDERIAEYEDLPYIETKESSNSAIFGGKNKYLLITGEYYWHNNYNDPFPIPDGEIDIHNGRKKIDENEAYLKMKLEIDGNFWDGEKWVKTNTTFKLPYVPKGNNYRNDNIIYKNTSFKSTVNWRNGLDSTGYLIPLGDDVVINGMPKLTIYKPKTPKTGGLSDPYFFKHHFVALKNFDIKAVVSDPTFSDNNNTDTVYTNIINEANVTELSEITFKICTNDDKDPSFSVVGVTDENGTMRMLDKVYTCNGAGRQEEQLVNRLYKQYSTTSVILNLELKNNNKMYGLFKNKTIYNKQFIVDKCSFDYKNNLQTVKLVEKK